MGLIRKICSPTEIILETSKIILEGRDHVFSSLSSASSMETSTHRVSTQYILAKTKRSKTKHAFLTPVHLFNCCHSSKPSANPHSSAAYSALPSQEHLPFLSPNTVLSMYCPAFPTPCPCVFAFLLQLLGSSLGT